MVQRRGNPRLTAGPMPDGIETSVVSMTASDGARVPGVLYRVPGSRTVATLMHPRLDLTRHYLTTLLTASGISVFAHGTRSVGNDLTLVHEQAVLDAGAGFVRVRELGFDHVVAVGASGGGTLYAFYAQQARRPPGERVSIAPGGRPTGLAEADLPEPDGIVFVAAHPGQGELLLGCIDPAVAAESDPLVSVPELDLFDTTNGFVEPFESSRYGPDFLEAYRAAQRARVARLDARAHEMLDERAAAASQWERDGRSIDRRRRDLDEVLTVHRTDADPRNVDLSLDPSDRHYGSVHGSRTATSNLKIQGFGRLSTAEAWLSTWSGLSSNARFVSCASDVACPTLFIEYSGDQANFPSVSASMFASIAAVDKTHERVRGAHFGGALAANEAPGGELAAASIATWAAERFEVV